MNQSPNDPGPNLLEHSECTLILVVPVLITCSCRCLTYGWIECLHKDLQPDSLKHNPYHVKQSLLCQNQCTFKEVINSHILYGSVRYAQSNTKLQLLPPTCIQLDVPHLPHWVKRFL